MSQLTPMTSAEARIDKIVYLASLVSDVQNIEHYLNPLRMLTASRPTGSALTPTEEHTLDGIEKDIKKYLLESEPLRSFTPESLDQQLYERVEAPHLVKGLRRRVVAILIAAVVVIFGVFSLPFGTVDGRIELSLSSGIALCYWGGVLFFLTSRRKFSPALKSAYKIFAYAFIVGSTTSICNAILTLIYKGETPWNYFWFINPIAYATFAAMYLGARQLAQLYSIKNLAMNGRLVATIAAGGSLLLMLFPWSRTLDTATGTNSAGAYVAFVFAAFSAWLIYEVWRASSPQYKPPTIALGLGMICAMVSWGIVVLLPLLPLSIRDLFSYFSGLLFIVASLFLLLSGYALGKLSHY